MTFEPEVEALIRQIDAERQARLEMQQIEALLDSVEAAPVSEQELDAIMAYVTERIRQEQQL